MISVIVFTLIIATSCDTKKPDQEIVTERIQYDVIINNQEKNYDWWIDNIPGPQRENLINWIFENAYSGKLSVYDYFNQPLSPEEIRSAGTDTLLLTLKRITEPFEEYDTTIVKKLDKRDINKVRFLEVWYFDKNKKAIEKKVLAIAPVREKYDEQGNFLANEPLFWLYFNNPKNIK